MGEQYGESVTDSAELVSDTAKCKDKKGVFTVPSDRKKLLNNIIHRLSK